MTTTSKRTTLRSPRPVLPLLLALSALGPRHAAAEPATPQPVYSLTPDDPQRAPQVGYLTQSGRRLPLLQYGPYQSARRRWEGGFITTMSSLGLVATGVGLILIGSLATGGLTPSGQDQVAMAGGVITGIGIAGVAAGAAVWQWGRHDLLLLEHGLPLLYQGGLRQGSAPLDWQSQSSLPGVMPPASLSPSVSLLPDGQGGLRLGLGLAGRF